MSYKSDSSQLSIRFNVGSEMFLTLSFCCFQLLDGLGAQSRCFLRAGGVHCAGDLCLLSVHVRAAEAPS